MVLPKEEGGMGVKDLPIIASTVEVKRATKIWSPRNSILLDELLFYGFIDKWKNSTPNLGDLRGLQFTPTLIINGNEHAYLRIS